MSFHIIHACALVFGCLSVLSSPVSLLLPQVFLPPLPDVYPWCLTRIPWKIPSATPASGAWSAWTMSHPSQKVASKKHSIYTHFPEDRICEVCMRTHMTRTLCRRRIGEAPLWAEKRYTCRSFIRKNSGKITGIPTVGPVVRNHNSSKMADE